MSDFDPHEAPSYGPRTAPSVMGHETAAQTVVDIWNSGRFPHGWLLAGPKGIGKATFAFQMARYILAASSGEGDPRRFAVPEHTTAARQVASGGHPGLFILERGWDDKRKRWKNDIAVDDVRRMVAKFFRHRAEKNAWRVAVVDSADDLNASSANALLKILEEPPPRTAIILVAHASGAVLPTIRSRCRRVVLKPLGEVGVGAILRRNRPELSNDDLRTLTRLADGSAGRAIALADAGGAEAYRELIDLLGTLPSLDGNRLQRYVEKLSRANAEPSYHAVCDLLRDLIAELASKPNGNGEAVAGEAALIGRLHETLPLDRKVALWEKVGGLIDRGDSANLDRKQVLLSAFFAFEAAARA